MTGVLSLSELHRYDVDPVRGFLPAQDPSRRLPSPFEPWDALAARLPALLRDKAFQTTVDALPELDPAVLEEPAAVERAMLLLSVFSNAYVWESNPPARRLPVQLGRPHWAVAKRLGRPPIVHHASMALSNWRRIDPAGSLEVENLETLISFTGLPDESWFFLVTVAIEAVGGPAIATMIEAQAAAAREDVAGVTHAVEALAENIGAVADLLERMYQRCEPAVFFREIRPWLTGWPEPGLVYQGGSEGSHRFTGGSAAQSSLIQAYDAVLGVSHPSPASGPFLLEMRQYMPPPHRRFLERLEQGISVAQFVRPRAIGAEPELHRAYDACIDQLDRFRKGHLAMAGRYITAQAKGDPTAKGTGGTDFGAFLGAARRETQDAKRGK
jgi:indoleamine 2,3-dioxygenase